MDTLKYITHILLIKITIKNFLRFFIGVSFKNEEKLKNIPQAIFIANHNSHLDTAVFLSIIPKERFLKTHPVAAFDYFTKNKFILFIVQFLFNIILLDRKKSVTIEENFRPLNQILNQGHSILYFPEGSRGTPEMMSEFKKGIGILLQMNPNIPFVPIYMKGLGKAMPKGDAVLIPNESEIIIGNPIYIKDHNLKNEIEITEFVKNEVIKLSLNKT